MCTIMILLLVNNIYLHDILLIVIYINIAYYMQLLYIIIGLNDITMVIRYNNIS